MSYILDALKKSEKERQRGAVPDLLTMQDVIFHGKQKRKTWPYVLAVAAVICISLSAYWLMPGKANRKTSDTNIVVAQKAGTEAPESLGERPIQHAGIQDNDKKDKTLRQANIEGEKRLKAPLASAKREEKLNVKEDPKAEQKTLAPRNAREASAAGKETLSVQSAQTAVKTEGHSVASPSSSQDIKPIHDDPAPVPGKIYDVGELPVSVKEHLPPVNMSIFMYSEDPASRMVRINGQTYREGQSLGEGLKLEEIRPDGVIINYRNYRLHIGQKP